MAHPEPRKRRIELLEDLRPGQPAIGAAHGKEKLGGEYIAVAADTGERLAQDLLGGAAAVDIGRVEQGDAAIEGAMHASDGGILLRAARKVEPGTEGDLRNGELAVTELAIFHWRRSGYLFYDPIALPIGRAHVKGTRILPL